MVGAGVIAAVANALDRRPFPFVFGGDGASFAVSGPTRRRRPGRARRDGRIRACEFQLEFASPRSRCGTSERPDAT